MVAAVIDTNVLLVANGSHPGVSPECQEACVRRLLVHKQSGVTVIDSGYLILSEYQNRIRSNQSKRVGDVFLKWLLQNKSNSARVHQVELNESRGNTFVEFPDTELQARFDPSDRKFVAVAHAHPGKPPVWQAVDSKWLDWWPDLLKMGVKVEFRAKPMCASSIVRSFPNEPCPNFRKCS